MASLLHTAALHYLFSKLPGEALAACAQVCREWRAVAASELLWQQLCLELEPHPHLRRDDLLPEFGGSHRAYFAWRWPMLRRPLCRILVSSELHPYMEFDDDEEEEEQQQQQPASSNSSGSCHRRPPEMAAYPVDAALRAGQQQQQVGGGMEADRGSAVAVAPWARHGVAAIRRLPLTVVQQPTLSPAGGLVAFCELRVARHGLLQGTFVVVADARTGRRLASWELAEPHPPFYFYWAACGTRLLFLSNWSGEMALRAIDVAPTLLPPAPGREQGREVLLCASRPLFLCMSPTSTRLLWHGGGCRFGLCDAATQTAEDGIEHDCFFVNPANSHCQAPQWVVDRSGTDHLLMPVTAAQPGDGEPAGWLVLASLAAVSEAYEADGSRLSPSLLLSLSQQVAPFSSDRGLVFAANVDASRVAWCDQGVLSVWFEGTNNSHQVFPPRERRAVQGQPEQQQAEQQADQQQQQQAGRATGQHGAQRRRGRGGASEHGLAGRVVALQWSPDGCRLLFLVQHGNALGTFRWMVYDPLAALPPPDAAQPSPGQLGSLTQCCSHNVAPEFLLRYAPFFDQYAHSMRLWSPSSDAFCFTCQGRPFADLDSQAGADAGWGQQLAGEGADCFACVQPAPQPEQASGSSSGVEQQAVGGLLLLQAPLPVCLAPGSVAQWSWN